MILATNHDYLNCLPIFHQKLVCHLFFSFIVFNSNLKALMSCTYIEFDIAECNILTCYAPFINVCDWERKNIVVLTNDNNKIF